MKFLHHIVFPLLILVIGFFLGVFSAPHFSHEAPDPESQPHEHHHFHSRLAVDPSLPVPTVSLDVQKDQESGYNLFLTTTNFTFAPEKAGTDDETPNEGHAHLYINDHKITRLYGAAYHVSDELLRSGENEIRVTLNTNNHADWMFEGEVIGDATTIVFE